MNLLTGHLLYLLALIAACLAVPEVVWAPGTKQFLLAFGLIATWRYSWAVINWLRFLLYRHLVFPQWRNKAESLGEAALPSQVFLLVTSFRIGAETTRRVYHSVFREAIECQLPVVVIASIVERADQAFIQQLFEMLKPPPQVTLVFVRIGGTGKRDALACGFRAISRRAPADDAVVAVIDGDSMLTPDSLRRCTPFFQFMPNLGALTTDEICEVEGNWLFREWYNLRFAQRHIYMGSVSLSRRVLTLTGRMSLFRAKLVCDPAFIQRIELDWIDHWRLGRFKFLTGDDKSSWFHLLAQGVDMIYVPDVTVITIEAPPDPRFFHSSLVLMRRWFGNMLRTNARALRLGPRIMGWFPWFAILDQRISMWTSLAGPALALLAGVIISPLALIYYLLWIAISRYFITLSLLVARRRVSAFYPFLLYYNQLVGSLVKITVLFRLDKQKWTRQGTTLALGRSRWQERRIVWGSMAMQAFAFTLFLLVLANLSGMLRVPEFEFWIQFWL